MAILVDSSQLERSLYMYTDFIGTSIPVVLMLNLMDVAEKKGIHIDVDKLSRRTGIPVIGFVASDAKRYGELKEQLAKAAASGKVADQSELIKYYRQDSELSLDGLADSQKDENLFTKEKLAISELEKTDKGLMLSGKHKYEYIDKLLDGVVRKLRKSVRQGHLALNRIALKQSRHFWKTLIMHWITC